MGLLVKQENVSSILFVISKTSYLFMATLGLGCCLDSLVVVSGFLIVEASLVARHGV